MSKNGNNTLTWRVTKLEENYNELSKKIDTILENHLPHLNSKVDRLTWLAGLNIMAILGSAILFKFL